MSTAELVSPKKSTGSSQGKPRSPSFKNKNCFSARLAAAKALSLQQMTKDAARVQIRKFFKQDVPLLFCDAVGLENGESAYDTNAVAELLLQYGIRKQCSSGSATLESARLKRRVAKVDLPEELYGWVHYRRPLEKEESEERESSGKSKKRRKSSSSMKFKKKLSLDPGRKRRKTYPVEEVVSPSPPPVPPKPPGKYAREAEERWTKLAEVQELYAKKAYLAAGFYSSAFKRGVIAGVDVENESPSRNSGRHRKVSKQAKPPAAKGSTSHRSAFPLPMYHGLKMMDEGDDFELPYDIHKFIEASGGVEECLNKHRASLPTPPPAKLPSPFVRIPRNIFVERKPYKPKEWEIPICRCDVPADGGPACTDNCLNWCTMIECHPKYCPAGDNCMNQQFRNQDTSALPSYLDLFWTNGRGYGLKVKTKIPRNQMVIEYRGEIISDETCIERMQTIYKGYENHYFLNYGKGEVIDACRKGTEARFVNHSCEPNCRIEKWEVDGECRVGIFSNREIEEGQELTYDYRFESYGPMQKCLCGASKCRGFIGVNKKEAKDAAKKAAEEANQTGTPDKGKSGKKKPKAKRLPLPRMESVSSAEGSVMCEDITDPASTILTPRTSQKKKLPVKKPNAERDFWLRKHRREHLITAYRNVMIKHYAQYAHLRIFSLRAFRVSLKWHVKKNLSSWKEIVAAARGASAVAEGKTRSGRIVEVDEDGEGSSMRSSPAVTAASSPSRFGEQRMSRKQIVARRTRSLDEIIRDLRIVAGVEDDTVIPPAEDVKLGAEVEETGRSLRRTADRQSRSRSGKLAAPAKGLQSPAACSRSSLINSGSMSVEPILPAAIEDASSDIWNVVPAVASVVKRTFRSLRSSRAAFAVAGLPRADADSTLPSPAAKDDSDSGVTVDTEIVEEVAMEVDDVEGGTANNEGAFSTIGEMVEDMVGDVSVTSTPGSAQRGRENAEVSTSQATSEDTVNQQSVTSTPATSPKRGGKKRTRAEIARAASPIRTRGSTRRSLGVEEHGASSRKAQDDDSSGAKRRRTESGVSVQEMAVDRQISLTSSTNGVPENLPAEIVAASPAPKQRKAGLNGLHEGSHGKLDVKRRRTRAGAAAEAAAVEAEAGVAAAVEPATAVAVELEAASQADDVSMGIYGDTASDGKPAFEQVSVAEETSEEIVVEKNGARTRRSARNSVSMAVSETEEVGVVITLAQVSELPDNSEVTAGAPAPSDVPEPAANGTTVPELDKADETTPLEQLTAMVDTVLTPAAATREKETNEAPSLDALLAKIDAALVEKHAVTEATLGETGDADEKENGAPTVRSVPAMPAMPGQETVGRRTSGRVSSRRTRD